MGARLGNERVVGRGWRLVIGLAHGGVGAGSAGMNWRGIGIRLHW